MGAVLIQTEQAGHPDRGNRGCRVELNIGTGREMLRHNLAGWDGELHIRFAFAAEHLSGNIMLLRVADEQGGTICSCSLNPQQGILMLTGTGNEALNAEYEKQRPWICTELVLDESKQIAEIYHDGIKSAEAAWDFSLENVGTVELGCCEKEYAATGHVDLDEWVIAAEKIGLVDPGTASGQADDGRHWLVLYRRNDEDSLAFALRCHSQYGIPLCNLLGLTVSSEETIDESDALLIVDEINNHLADPAIHNVIAGYWLSYGFPTLVQGGAGVRTLADVLHEQLGSATTFPVSCPDVNSQAARLAAVPAVFTADAPTLQDSISVLDRGTGLNNGEMIPVAETGIILDFGDDPPMAETVAAMQGSGAVVAVMGDQDSNINISSHAFLFREGSGTVNAGYPENAGGVMVLAAAVNPASVSFQTLRDDIDDTFAARVRKAGYAAVIAHVTPPAEAQPDPVKLVQNIIKGETLAWSIYEALQQYSPSMIIAGDPLLHLPVDQSALEILISGTEPTAGVRVTARLSPFAESYVLPVEERPADGEDILLAVRKVDAAGRPATVSAWRKMRRRGDELLLLPGPVLYPDGAEWLPARNGTEVNITLLLPQPPKLMDIAEITLQRMLADGSISDIIIESAADLPAFITRKTTLQPDSQQFRWLLRHTSGVLINTTWSGAVTPVDKDMTLTGIAITGISS